MKSNGTQDTEGACEPPSEPRRVKKRRRNRSPLSTEEADLLRLACRLSHTGGYKLDATTWRVFWSYEMFCIYELEPDTEISYEKAVSHCAPESRSEIRRAVDACVRAGTPFDLEFELITARGRRVWVRSRGKPLRDAQGRITHVHGSLQEITAKKQAERQLAQVAARLHNTLESITDALYTVDRGWRFTFVNRHAECLLQRRREDLLGKVLWDAIPGAAGGPYEPLLRQALRENRLTAYEHFYAPLQAWLDVRIFPSEEGLAVYFRDVSATHRMMEALRESEERFQIVSRVISDIVWDWDIAADRIWATEGIKALFGIADHEFSPGLGAWLHRIHPDDRERIRRALSALIGGSENKWIGEFRVSRKDGTYAEVRKTAWVMRDAGGSAVRMIGSLVDISERKQAQRWKREAEARLRAQAALLDKAHDAITVSAIDDGLTFWNQGAERLFGWSAGEALGRKETDFLVVDQDAFRNAMEIVHREGEWRGEIAKRHKSGSTVIVETRWTLVNDDAGCPQSVLSINTDITRRKQAEREIEQLAFFDTLTRLPNRCLLLDRLHHALASSGRNRHTGALLFIDLDNFKTLNDTLGHDKGDRLLQMVARRLETCVPRKTDTVARLGGDEFVVMLEDLSENPEEAARDAETVAEKILTVFAEPFRLDEHQYYSTASLGVALFDSQVRNVDDLLKRADLAMYQSKAAGRNAIHFFDPTMQTAVAARVALETDLREGLRAREFFLHYQRQSDASGRVLGVEALLRWKRSGRDIVSPELFIPLAEETGLILPLGRWVLEQACRQLAAWASSPETANLKVAVNVSARQFRHPEFVAQVLAVLDETGAAAHNLKLELTESLLIENLENTIATMNALREKGVSFSLDDFGTGYSSLSYLRRLPLDQLKIAQSFVRDILTDENDAAIACTILRLGESLGLEVIAEGVETEEQRIFLERNGCRAYQGYLFSPPLPAERF